MLRILCPFPGGVLRLLLAVVVLLSAVPVWAEPLDGGKKSFTLVIDAGHGGHDAGAVGKVGKDLTLEEGQKVTFDTECDPQNSSKIRATNVTVVA